MAVVCSQWWDICGYCSACVPCKPVNTRYIDVKRNLGDFNGFFEKIVPAKMVDVVCHLRMTFTRS